jgi:hypothetical protein
MREAGQPTCADCSCSNSTALFSSRGGSSVGGAMGACIANSPVTVVRTTLGFRTAEQRLPDSHPPWHLSGRRGRRVGWGLRRPCGPSCSWFQGSCPRAATPGLRSAGAGARGRDMLGAINH